MTVRTPAAVALIVLCAPLAAAQPVSVDQIAPSNRHVADVEQVPGARTERRDAAAPALTADAPVDTVSGAQVAPARRVRTSVDADEIARLLSGGKAGSIDAAAAIATGAVDATATAADEPEDAPTTEQPIGAESAITPKGESR